MVTKATKDEESFGGDWTVQKLNILKGYLDAYTTALKRQPFSLVYIDAFAGTGYVELGKGSTEARKFIEGSATIAVKIDDKQFDKLVFIERDPRRCDKLRKIQRENQGRNIRIENCEANDFLVGMKENWSNWRGVLFLDPFATQVQWSTIEKIAGLNALDTWILFPTSAVSRILPLSRKPEDIKAGWAERLNRIYGDGSWRELYSRNPQMNLFGVDEYERAPGVSGLVEIYKDKLGELFGNRFLQKSRALKNSNNSGLFEFLFCVGNEAGIGPAKKIAEHILEHM